METKYPLEMPLVKKCKTNIARFIHLNCWLDFEMHFCHMYFSSCEQVNATC